MFRNVPAPTTLPGCIRRGRFIIATWWERIATDRYGCPSLIGWIPRVWSRSGILRSEWGIEQMDPPGVYYTLIGHGDGPLAHVRSIVVTATLHFLLAIKTTIALLLRAACEMILDRWYALRRIERRIRVLDAPHDECRFHVAYGGARQSACFDCLS